jgi:two-component system phosphate regulon sensor histidine kinase PhoR
MTDIKLEPPAHDSGGFAAERPRKQDRANLFSTMLDAMTDGVLVVDDQLRVVVTNRALRETLLLRPRGEFPKLPDLIAEPALSQAFAEVLAGSPTQTVEFRYRGLTDRTLDVLVVPLPDHEFWGHRALGVVRDVTQQRRVEQMLMDFIANASHELRTPTTAILGYAETLVDAPPKDPKKREEFHQAILRHAERLSHLLGQLLDLSRLDQLDWRLAPTAIDAGALITQLAEHQSEAAQKAGLSVRIVVPEQLPPVLADRGALDMIVGNLFQNAIKYTPTGGRVEIKAAKEMATSSGTGQAVVRISVTDSGIGIRQEDQARVFERFYRVDKGRSRQAGGVGLGLSIVKALVDRMGGRLELQSTIGKGSTFSVLLPVAAVGPVA